MCILPSSSAANHAGIAAAELAGCPKDAALCHFNRQVEFLLAYTAVFPPIMLCVVFDASAIVLV